MRPSVHLLFHQIYYSFIFILCFGWHLSAVHAQCTMHATFTESWFSVSCGKMNKLQFIGMVYWMGGCKEGFTHCSNDGRYLLCSFYCNVNTPDAQYWFYFIFFFSDWVARKSMHQLYSSLIFWKQKKKKENSVELSTVTAVFDMKIKS